MSAERSTTIPVPSISRIADSSAATKKPSPRFESAAAVEALMSSALIAAAISGPGSRSPNAPAATAPTKAMFVNSRVPPSAAASRSRSTTANTRNARQPIMKIQPPVRIELVSSLTCVRWGVSGAPSGGVFPDSCTMIPTTHSTTASTPV